MKLRTFRFIRSCGSESSSCVFALRLLCNFFKFSQHRIRIGNLAGTAFPLFTTQMYAKLDFKWASTLFGCIAVLMMPIPFIVSQRFPSHYRPIISLLVNSSSSGGHKYERKASSPVKFLLSVREENGVAVIKYQLCTEHLLISTTIDVNPMIEILAYPVRLVCLVCLPHPIMKRSSTSKKISIDHKGYCKSLSIREGDPSPYLLLQK